MAEDEALGEGVAAQPVGAVNAAADLARGIEPLAVHELGDLVVVVGDGVDHVALDLAGVGHGGEDARLGDQVGTAALASAGMERLPVIAWSSMATAAA